MVVCDTHALIFDALDPKQLGRSAARAIEEAAEAGELACADISLWEIAMLMSKGRLTVPATPESFLAAVVAARRLQVLPITAPIAALSASVSIPQADPADRLIAATACVHSAPLVTRDQNLRSLSSLTTIW